MERLTVLDNDKGAVFICSTLEKNGYESYAVGGCVRDALMSLHPHDVDITTQAKPDEVISLFRFCGLDVIETGLKHGTVTVVFEGKPYEVTTMRKEGGYTDSRHPDKVEFISDISFDLSRRDLTVNAIAYRISTGEMVDLYGGVEDINNRTLKTVGTPEARFAEDPLRILRALRFSSVLGFDIDVLTAKALIATKCLLSTVSAERKFSELKKLLCGHFAGRIIYDYAEVLSELIPQLYECKGFDQHSKYHVYDVLKHICVMIDNVPPIPYMRFAALFHDIGKPGCFSLDENGEGHFYSHAHLSTEICEETLKQLKADKFTIESAVFLVKHHDTPLPTDDSLLKKRINKIGIARFLDLIEIAAADCKAQSPLVSYRLQIYDELRQRVNDIRKSGECLDLAHLDINGNDIIDLGVKEGKIVGEVLRYLLELVLSGRIANTRNQLIDHATEYVDKLPRDEF